MTDLQDLKSRLDLLDEVEKDLGPGKKSGRWVMFGCPFPGHAHGDRRPSLAVTPADGRYFCFTCGATGDVITWLLSYRGLSWRDLFDLAGSGNLPPARPRPVQAAPAEAPSGPPAASWQARGLAFVDECAARLWTPAGARALAYLRSERALTDDTIKAFKLGYNPADSWDTRAAWALPDEPNGKGVWLPRGVTIPNLAAENLWSVNIRRPAGDPKYYKIRGSRRALFNADRVLGAELILITEGEFDCILAYQELGDVAGVVTLGAASNRLDLATWGVYLLPARVILAALDPDPAGKGGAAALADLSARVHIVRVPALAPGGKDITDYHRAGGDLWQWLRHNLDRLDLLKLLGAPAQRDDDIPAELQEALALGNTQPAALPG